MFQKLPRNFEFIVTRVQYLYFERASGFFFFCKEAFMSALMINLRFTLLLVVIVKKVAKLVYVSDPTVPWHLISSN